MLLPIGDRLRMGLDLTLAGVLASLPSLYSLAPPADGIAYGAAAALIAGTLAASWVNDRVKSSLPRWIRGTLELFTGLALMWTSVFVRGVADSEANLLFAALGSATVLIWIASSYSRSGTTASRNEESPVTG